MLCLSDGRSILGRNKIYWTNFGRHRLPLDAVAIALPSNRRFFLSWTFTLWTLLFDRCQGKRIYLFCFELLFILYQQRLVDSFDVDAVVNFEFYAHSKASPKQYRILSGDGQTTWACVPTRHPVNSML